MTETEHFDLVLKEIESLMVALGRVGLGESVVLVGAQVVALEQRARNQAPFELELPTGLRLTRGFSFEPDFVFDTEEDNLLDRIPDAMRAAGFVRVLQAGKPARWSKKVGEITVDVDLFGIGPEADSFHSVSLPQLRGAPRLPLKEIRLSETWNIKVPDPYAYLSLKLEAKLRIRPAETKDSVDIFAYAHVVGPEEINRSLDKRDKEGARVRSELRELFGAETAQGVLDVVSGLGSTLESAERALLVRAVLDTFESIF